MAGGLPFMPNPAFFWCGSQRDITAITLEGNDNEAEIRAAWPVEIIVKDIGQYALIILKSHSPASCPEGLCKLGLGLITNNMRLL